MTGLPQVFGSTWGRSELTADTAERDTENKPAKSQWCQCISVSESRKANNPITAPRRRREMRRRGGLSKKLLPTTVGRSTSRVKAKISEGIGVECHLLARSRREEVISAIMM
jgi:hypothetical protein